MPSDDAGLPVALCGMADCVVAGDLSTHLAVVPRAFSCNHMGLAVRRRVARDVLSADVADGHLLRAKDGHLLRPCGLDLNPDLLGVLNPLLLLCGRLGGTRRVGASRVLRGATEVAGAT